MFSRIIIIVPVLFLAFAAFIEATDLPVQNQVIIDTYHVDLTGNGNEETIQLEGELLSSKSTYFPFIAAKIKSKNGESWEIRLPGGFEPSLQFIDVTNDGVKELLYKSSRNNNANLSKYKLYTFEEMRFISIPLPKDSFVHGKFQENFLAHIYITPHDDPVIIDLKDTAEDYIHMDIYDQNGGLLKQQDISIEPIHSILPVSTGEASTVIETLQYVSSLTDSKKLGMIQSKWRYIGLSWELLDSSWKQ